MVTKGESLRSSENKPVNSNCHLGEFCPRHPSAGLHSDANIDIVSIIVSGDEARNICFNEIELLV